MKKILFTALLLCVIIKSTAQVFTTNDTPVGMEHNVLFNATTRFTVTQTGNASLSLSALFDGRFVPSYTSVAPTTSSPTVILIEDLPNSHTQVGAWIGWSTRFWQAKRFKIEGYNVYANENVWKTFADYSTSDYTAGRSFRTKLPMSGSYTKLRFTFYEAVGTNGRLGVSELFFLHPEAVRPYQGLLAGVNSNLDLNGSVKFDKKNNAYTNIQLGHDINDRIIADNNSNKHYGGGYFFRVTPDPSLNIAHNYMDVMTITDKGNVGIGTMDPKGYQLAVAGDIIAEEIKVKLKANWPDYVFTKEYDLPTLKEVENHINEKGHLENIPSAKEVKENDGIELGEINRKLLQKIEELTLYTIQQQKEIQEQSIKSSKEDKKLLLIIQQLEKRIKKFEK